MDSLNSTYPQPAMATYSDLLDLAAHQQPQLSGLERLWWAHYAYWDNNILATGKSENRNRPASF
jgi:methylsterol monooxygenase